MCCVREKSRIWAQAPLVGATTTQSRILVSAKWLENLTGVAEIAVLLFVAVAGLSSAGCTTTSRNTLIESRVLSLEPASNVVQYEPFKRYDLVAIVNTHQQPSIEVSCAKGEEISQQYPETGLQGLAVGLGVGILLAFPTAGQSLALIPAITISGILNSSHRNAVLRAFQETDFPKRLGDFLRTKLSVQYGGEPSSEIKVQVLIDKYGIWGNDSALLWFYCDAEFQVVQSGTVVFSDKLVWRALRRNSDLPPPRYASLDDYAQHEGRLVREVLTEAAEVLAAVVAKRLRGP